MRAVYPLVITILAALLLAFLISDAWRDSRQRRLTDEAIQTARKWQSTAEKWEQIANEWELTANRCILESERR